MTELSQAFIQAVRIKREAVEPGAFPFCLPAFAKLNELDLHPQVTFFVGENGSGNATIYRFDGEGISACSYEELEHVQVTRDFLNNPARYLRHLLDDEDA